MMLLKASIIIWISAIRTIRSQDSHFLEQRVPNESGNPCHRPWEKSVTSVAWLSLEGMGLQTVSPSFRLHFNESPQWLVLDGNLITHISPEAFETLGANLTYLSLARNRISKIEMALFHHLDKLEVLNLDQNPVKVHQAIVIPCNSASLKSLYLRYCTLPSFNLPSCENSLAYLYLSGNEILVFYTKTDSWLTHLHLDNNQLGYVTLSKLNSLVYLDVSNNRLNGIARHSGGDPADDAENFEKYARSFWSPHPASKKQLYLDRAAALKYLIVSVNRVSEIEPDTFEDMKELIHVDLSNNEIGKLRVGTFENLFELRDILLDANRITEIDRGSFVNLFKLRTISLKNNLIEKFDGNALAQLNSITNDVSLFLDNNKICTLASDSFRGITELTHIGLSGNRIKTISSQAFVDLPYLRSVVIENQSRNRSAIGVAGMKEGLIESNAFLNLSNLASITIRGNSFAEIAALAFHELPKLKTLDLSKNNISYISPEAFNDLPRIEVLNLEGNELLKTKPKTFPKHLKRLNAAWNFPRKDFEALHIGDLHQLEELDVSGTIESFEVNELSTSPKTLRIIVGRTKSYLESFP